MNDMSRVIVPKSDQMNSDDLIGGPRTITITEVEIRAATEQPVSIHFEGDDGKPWKPCKSMSRVLVQAWGPDASKYAGRSLTLYRDPKVKWGGLEVGGIRISHMSHIDGKMQMALTETRGKRTPFVVMPLADAPKPATKPDAATNWTNAYVSKVSEAPDADALEAFVTEKAAKLAELESKRPELHAQCITAVEARRADFSTFADGDDFSDDLPAYHTQVEAIRSAIPEADGAGLTELRKEFLSLKEGIPDDDLIAAVEQQIADRGRALEREAE